MKPRGPLMAEHRLIEKMLALAQKKTATMTAESYDPVFVDSVVDFIKTYADRTHHGKEEDLLFVALAGKKLDAANARIMDELVDEHAQARRKVGELVDLNRRFVRGDRGTVGAIRDIIAWLGSFYPVHIKKEDEVFFPATERYFDTKELDALLAAFWDFDRKMIHEKYERLYASLLPL
jgi:hemerythrin-like domain-containing protein